MITACGGLALGAAMVTLPSFRLFIEASPFAASQPRPSPGGITIGRIYLPLAAMLFYLFRRYMKTTLDRGELRSLIAGAMIGAAVTCLCEGACFLQR